MNYGTDQRTISSGPDSFFAGWEDEDEGSLRSNRFGALAEEEVSQLPRPSRRLVLVSGERPNVSQEVAFQPWATSPQSSHVMSRSLSERNKFRLDPSCRLMTPVGLRKFGDSPLVPTPTAWVPPGDLEGDVDGSFVSGDEEVFEVPAVEMVPPVRPSAALMRASFMGLDEWNLEEMFSHRGSLMRSVPRFLWGSFRVATKLALEEIQHGVERGSELQQERG